MTTSTPTFFATPVRFRSWLKRNHRKAKELLVGFHKKDSGRPSMTWPESVDEALCFGWIDGVRKSFDDTSYTIRFTPRRSVSTWSHVNITRVAALIAEGRMQAPGLAAFERRTEEKSRTYAYEQRHLLTLSPPHQKRLEASRKAWTFFQAQPPGYRRQMTFWVVSAKREETQLKRLAALISASAAGKRL